MLGFEMEFYVLQPDAGAPGGFGPLDIPSHRVYGVGSGGDTTGLMFDFFREVAPTPNDGDARAGGRVARPLVGSTGGRRALGLIPREWIYLQTSPAANTNGTAFGETRRAAIQSASGTEGSVHVPRPLLDWQLVLHPRGTLPRESPAPRQLQKHPDALRQFIRRACAAHRPSQPMHRDGHDQISTSGIKGLAMLAHQQRGQGRCHSFTRRSLGSQHRLPQTAAVGRQHYDASPATSATLTEPAVIAPPVSRSTAEATPHVSRQFLGACPADAGRPGGATKSRRRFTAILRGSGISSLGATDRTAGRIHDVETTADQPRGTALQETNP